MVSTADLPTLAEEASQVEGKLKAGSTWRDLTKEERQAIVYVSRIKGLSWRAIAERVGKPRRNYTTIYNWVADHCPALLNSSLTLAPHDPRTHTTGPGEVHPEDTPKTADLSPEKEEQTMPAVFAQMARELATVKRIAQRLDEHLAQSPQRVLPSPAMKGAASVPPPPLPPSKPATAQASGMSAESSPSEQKWEGFDWSQEKIRQLSQPEIESIPAAILESLPTAVLTQLNERMAELQRLAAMTPEERTAYLQVQAAEQARAEIAKQKTNELEDHALFQRGREQWDDSAVGGRGRLGRWDRQLEYWYCLTCKQRFPFERTRNGHPKPEKCPECYARDIEPWAPGEEFSQEIPAQGE